jgi:predicted transcriptional regulator
MEKITNFRRYRMMNNITQTELARKVGVTHAAVARLDKYGCHDTRTASKYARAIKCNPLYLLDGLDMVFAQEN